jgi:ribosomal protein L21E
LGGFSRFEARSKEANQMMEVKTFKDRNGIKVEINDVVGYFHLHKHVQTGRVVRITKSGYFIEIFTEGRKHPWYKTHVEKLVID